MAGSPWPSPVDDLGSIAAVLLILARVSVADLSAFYLIWAGIGLAMAAVLMGARNCPVGGSLLYDGFGGYLPALWSPALLSFAATLVIATVPHRP